MQDVQFSENQGASSFDASQQLKSSLVTRLVIKLGLAKDQQGANKAMLLISVFCLLLMSYFLISTFFPSLFRF